MNPETSMHRAIFIRGFHTLPFSLSFSPDFSSVRKTWKQVSRALLCSSPPLLASHWHKQSSDGAVGMQWSCKTPPSTG